MTILSISKGAARADVNLDNGQLCGFSHNGVEAMWGGGRGEGAPKGTWQSSSIVMCPIIGPAVNDTIFIGGVPYKMGQHGLSRALKWKRGVSDDASVTLWQHYNANEVVNVKGTPSSFPASFRVFARYSVDEVDGGGRLKIELSCQNRSKTVMPVAIGLHPAFVPSKNGQIAIIDPYNDGTDSRYSRVWAYMSMQDIEASDTLKTYTVKEIHYITPEFKLKVKHDMRDTWIWKAKTDAENGNGAPDTPICIEPVSAVPINRDERPTELSNHQGYERVLREGDYARHVVDFSLKGLLRA